MQSGINKTKANLVPYVSTEPFLNIMDTAVDDFTKLLADPGKASRLLEDFYNKFNAQNSFSNKEKSRFKNYFTDIDFSKVGTGGAIQVKKGTVEKTNNIILRSNLKANPASLYLFGDNDVRKGLGGQAKEMRGEPNAIGISTKKLPARGEEAYKSDAELEENKKIITEDINKAIAEWNTGKYNKLVIPQMGVGLAELPTRAPETYKFLQQELKRLENHVAQPATAAVEEQTNNLTTTSDPNIFIFDDAKTKTADYYRQLTSSNSTVGFVYNASKHELDKNVTIGSQSFLRFVSPDTALPFITSFGNDAADRSDNFSNLAADKYQSVKNYFDRKIQELKDAKDLGNKIALPKAGIGDAKKMPQILVLEIYQNQNHDH
jgi:hypothetical protein